jgi:hypothetical protein
MDQSFPTDKSTLAKINASWHVLPLRERVLALASILLLLLLPAMYLVTQMPTKVGSKASERQATAVGQSIASSDLQFTVESARDLGEIGKPANVSTRDGGSSMQIGKNIVWVFDDTLFSPKSEDGQNLRSNTTGLADPATPSAVNEPLDSTGAPYQTIPFTAEENEYNRTATDSSRIALWPMSAYTNPSGEGIIYSLKLIVHPGFLNYEFLGVNIAKITEGSTQAQRMAEDVFKSPELLFMRAVVQDPQYVYLYDCDKLKTSCYIARVEQNRITDRASYSFWNGSDWVADINAAKTVINASSSGFSVAWNSYLSRYLAVYNKPFSNQIMARTALRPEGPWSSEVALFTGQTPGAGNDYAAQLHPELFTNEGKHVAVTYYRPGTLFKGELRLVDVLLNISQTPAPSTTPEPTPTLCSSNVFSCIVGCLTHVPKGPAREFFNNEVQTSCLKYCLSGNRSCGG